MANASAAALLAVALLGAMLLAGPMSADAAKQPPKPPRKAKPPPYPPGTGPTTCPAMFGIKPIPFLFVADPGGFTGSAEAKYLFENLKAVTTIYTFSAHCAGMYVGNLMSQRVVLTTTGIGPMQATSCVQAILSKCAKNVKMAVYMGTSGFPAAIGGILNPPDCSAPSPKRGKGQVTRIGDLCITPFSINWDCKLADWTQQATGYPNLCFRPTENAGPTVTSLYGKCLFYNAPTTAISLAADLAAAARSTAAQNAYPATLAGTVAYTNAYWNYTIAGTGVDYYQYAPTDPINVWDATQCVEVDSQFFFSGVPWEITTRDYAALTLNLAYNTTTYNATNVVYSNAMEGIGLGFAFEAHNAALPADKKIPYSIIRGNSDYTHMPVKNLGNGNWTYEFELPGDFVNNYKTAIISYSVAIMTYFKNLCLAQGLPDCTFVIDG